MPVLLDDDGFVAHRRNVGAACGARAHHHGDLRNALRRQARLIEEDAAEVLAVRKHLILHRQEGAAGIDEIHAGQVILRGDLLRAQVLLHRDRKVGAALHGGVVRDDHHVASMHSADAGDDARGRRAAVVHAAGGERGQLQERHLWIAQHGDAIAHQELAALGVLAPRILATAQAGHLEAFLELGGEAAHVGGVRMERFGAAVDVSGNHAVASNSSRPMSMRRISLVPAPIS